MLGPDRLRLLAVSTCTLALLITTGCGQQGGADKDRLQRIERRLDALEKRIGSGQALSPTLGRSVAGAPGPIAPPATVANTSTYVPGVIASVHAAPANARALSEVPADSVGGFVYTGGPVSFHDLSSRGIRYSEFTGVELQGWFKAMQGGRYQFGEDLHGTLGPNAIIGADCGLQVWLEDRVVGAQQNTLPPSYSGEARMSLVVGADLQPGVYKLRLWTACAPHFPRQAHITADLLVKAPGDLNLRGFNAGELLHRPTS